MLPAILNAEPIEDHRPPTVMMGVQQTRTERRLSVSAPEAVNGRFSVDLPDRIPASCVTSSARDYRLNPMILLAVLKVESNGRTGIVSPNKNGTHDLGPAQFNTNTWAKRFEVKYNIPREALINDMCQAIRAMAFAVRTEIDSAGGDFWRGVGNYHSRTPVFHQRYLGLIEAAHRKMLKTGKF